MFSANTRSRNLKKNVIASICIKGISILIQLCLVPATLNFVTPEIYGIWLTLSSITLWFGFLDVGLTLGLKNRLTEAIAVGDWNRGRQLVSTTYGIMMLIFIPLMFFLLIICPLINWTCFLNTNSLYEMEILNSIRILVVCFCMQMIVNVVASVAAAFQQTAISALFPVVGNFVSLCAIIVLPRITTPSLHLLSLSVALTPILAFGIGSIIMFKKKYRKVAPSFYCFNKSLVKDLLGLGLNFFIIQIQCIVLFQSTNVLISHISSPIDVSRYNVAYKFINVAAMLFSIVLGPLWPAITDAFTKKDFTWLCHIYMKMKKIWLGCACAVILMIILSPIAYHLWIGSSIDVPLDITMAVGLYVIISTWNGLHVNIINGTGKVKLQSRITLVGLFLHIPLACFLGRFVGMLGVVCSMVLITVFYSIVFTVQAKKIITQQDFGIWSR